MFTHAAGGRLVTVEEIANTYGISRAHLMKVVNALTRAGYLTPVRGRFGGLRLARRAEDISLGDVVRSVEPGFDVVECFSTGECAIAHCCKLQVVLRDAIGAFLEILDHKTLADIALRPKDFLEVCELSR
jgi:Rrf2 family nitric oxide-sensitive transcriptional repressor